MWGPRRRPSPPGTARTRPFRRASARRRPDRLRRPCSRCNKSCPRCSSRRIDRPCRDNPSRCCPSRPRRLHGRPRPRRWCSLSRRVRTPRRPAPLLASNIVLDSWDRSKCNRWTRRTRGLVCCTYRPPVLNALRARQDANLDARAAGAGDDQRGERHSLHA